jgi:hypothetical protein
MHDPEICSMDRIVGIKDVRDPMLVVVISTPCYLDFISYAVTLASFCTISLDQRRRSSCVVSWVRSDVCLNIGSIGCVVCRGISRRVGWSVGRSIGSGIDRLRYFVFASSFFSHRVEGTLATMSLTRVLRSASGVGTCCGSTISRTSFFNLSSCNANVGLEASDHWGIFEVIQSSKSSSKLVCGEL